MISGLSKNSEDRVDVAQRKAAFRANCHIWGLQVRARIGCVIIQPNGEDDRRVDMVMIRGIVGLSQLRPHRPFVISSVQQLDRHDVSVRRVETAVPGLEGPEHAVNILREYCTEPLPEIRNRTTAQGTLVTEVLNRDVGTASAFTGFLCDVFRAHDRRYRGEGNPVLGLGSTIRYPVEVSIADTFVRAGTFGDDPLRFRSATRNILGMPGADGPDGDLLFTDDAVEHLGRGTEALHLPDHRRYPEMIADVMGRIGWDPDEFEAYRHRLPYPVMPSAIMTTLDLPEDPDPARSRA